MPASIDAVTVRRAASSAPFIQEGVPCNYDFQMYTYGPFSATLLADLNVAGVVGSVNVEYKEWASGYEITPGENSDQVRAKAAEFLRDHSNAIGKVVHLFHKCNAKELELRSTIVFLRRQVKGGEPHVSENDLINLVREVKPHFDPATVRSAIKELRDIDYVE